MAIDMNRQLVKILARIVSGLTDTSAPLLLACRILSLARSLSRASMKEKNDCSTSQSAKIENRGVLRSCAWWVGRGG